MEWIYIAFFIASALHMTEEYFFPGGFMDVMKRVNPSFGPLVTTPAAIIINALQLVLCLFVIAFGEKAPVFGMSVAGLFIINGLAHIVGCVRVRGYAPGVVTGVGLYLPLAAHAYYISLSSGRLTGAGDVALTLALGLLYNAVPIVYFLLGRAIIRRV
jgi:hypothetical protein